MKRCIFLVVVLTVFCGLGRAEESLESRNENSELVKRCHGEFKGAMLEKRSLGDVAELSVLLKRCLIGGSRSSGELE